MLARGEDPNSHPYCFENLKPLPRILAEQRERVRHTLAYGQWLPQPANERGRQGAEDGYMKKPDDYRYVPPVICAVEKE